MVLLGLAGKARSGKDTVAAELVRNYGFLQFSFSDALYREVAEAYGVPVENLQHPGLKDMSHDWMALDQCSDEAFREVAVHLLPALLSAAGQVGWFESRPLSPRWVLQTWGAEYRRAQDPDYWLKQADAWLLAQHKAWRHPEQRPMYFVNTSVRFPNEQAWVHAKGGNVWHIRRDAAAAVQAHESETPLPVLDGERELVNNGTLQALYERGLPMMMRGPFLRVRVDAQILGEVAPDIAADVQEGESGDVEDGDSAP
jgi:hypothetical protein